MKKRTARALVLILILAFAAQAMGQSNDEAQELYEAYLKRQAAVGASDMERYRSPNVYDDTSSAASAQLPTTHDSTLTDFRETPHLRTDTLRLFGYDMFAQTVSGFAPPLVATVPPDYKLGPGDNLLVNLWGRVDMELNLTVSREGTVFIPKVGDVVCNGLTLEEAEERLKQRFSQTYSDFSMSVSMGKIRTITVYVYGEVKQPGGYTLSSLSALFNALYAARGPNERGSMRQIRLLRSGRLIAEVDLYNFLLDGDLSGDLKLESEDILFVPLANSLVKVAGQVRRPAIYELRDGERISDVIAMAGGTASTAYVHRIMVERVGNDHHEVIDVDMADPKGDGARMVMQDGDAVTIFATDQTRENIVWVSGRVKHPGVFQLQDRPRISDLIFDGAQLYHDTYLERADLIRTHTGSREEIVPVNLRNILSGDESANLRLQHEDSLVVYAVSDVTRKKHVSIIGEVARPGLYLLYDSMKVSDLIFRAGTLERSAFMLSAELARLTPNGNRELYSINLMRLIDKQDPTADMLLAEDDQVYIRMIPGWRSDRIITVEGEVRFPGQYSLSYRKETLRELIERAGGLTENAFPGGLVFLRPTIANDIDHGDIEGIIRRSAELERDSTGTVSSSMYLDIEADRLTRIVIDLDAILKSENRENDIVLQPGDRITIPVIPFGVPVMGAVASIGTIAFSEGKRPSYYVKRAGGFVRSSDKEETRIIKADGRVMTWSEAKRKNIELGDAIAVPTRVIEKRDWFKILSSTATVIGGLATTVFVIDKL